MAGTLADHTAATTAGYIRVQADRGATFGGGPRFLSRYEKPRVGHPGQSGSLLVAEGVSAASQAAADTAALNVLIEQRQKRYGYGSANTGKDIHGNTLTDDLH